MKLLTKALAILVLLVASTHFALAAPISGSLSFAGTYTGSFGPSTITFSGQPVAVYNGTGNMAAYNGASGSMTFNYPTVMNGMTILFAVPTPGTTNQGLMFVVNSASFSPATTGSSATFNFTGVLENVQTTGTVNGQACSAASPCILGTSSATLAISPSGAVDPSTGIGAYSATLVASTPEPSSLLLLGTGLFGAAAVVFRRRHVAQQVLGC